MSPGDLQSVIVLGAIGLIVLLFAMRRKETKGSPLQRIARAPSQPQGRPRVHTKPPTPTPQEFSDTQSPVERRPPRIQRLIRGKKQFREAILIQEILRRPWY